MMWGMNYLCFSNGDLFRINEQKMLTLYKSFIILRLYKCLAEKVPMSYEDMLMNHRPN